ncbi:MAG: hypothetical protein M1840_001373 [Geoglossum simile]|nr:MAG: hypothetical protein M1840_001373 [Geoglossum simile]
MPPHRAHIPPAAKPTRNIFDPWNASLTGHQRGENHIGHSLGWRSARTRMLQEQYRGEDSERGSQKGRRERSVRDMLLEKGAMKRKVEAEGEGSSKVAILNTATSTTEPEEVLPNRGLTPPSPPPAEQPKPKQIFRSLTIHISGSTAPLVSDHRLKQLLASRGARISLTTARRTVTHVVLGKSNEVGRGSGGAGGGLAAGKIQREVTRVRGGGAECGVQYVGVEWALDSIKAGKRLSEAAYSPMGLVAGRQKSVYGIFNVTKKDTVAAVASGLKSCEGGALEGGALEGGSNGGKENSQPSPPPLPGL